MNYPTTKSALCVALPLITCPLAQAVTVVSNLESSSGFGAHIIGSLAHDSVAQGFSTPATGSWTLDSLVFKLLEVGSHADTSFTVALYSETGGAPDQQLGILTGPPPSTGSATDYTFTPTTTITLNPGTTYFAVLSDDASLPGSGNTYEWHLAADAGSGDPGWAIDATGLSRNFVGEWNDTASPLYIAVNATSVPEPASAGLLALGSLAFLGRRRRS